MTDRQRQFARGMRAQPTDAERVLWQRLRHDVTLAGSHFFAGRH
jgi:very-short-patch-repair endonuclease